MSQSPLLYNKYLVIGILARGFFPFCFNEAKAQPSAVDANRFTIRPSPLAGFGDNTHWDFTSPATGAAGGGCNTKSNSTTVVLQLIRSCTYAVINKFASCHPAADKPAPPVCLFECRFVSIQNKKRAI